MTTSKARVPARLVIVGLVLVMVLPALVFIGILLRIHAASERSRIARQAIEIAGVSATVIDRKVEGWRTTLQTLATSQHLREGNYAGFYEQALRVKEIFGANVTLRRPDKSFVVNTRVPFGASIPPASGQLDDEVAARGPTMSNVFLGALTREPLVAMIVPIRSDGAVRYFLGISAPTDLIRDVVRPVVPQPWSEVVLDRRGVYVINTQEKSDLIGQAAPAALSERASGPSGAFERVDLAGRRVVSGYVRSEFTGWLAVASIDKEVAERQLRNALWAFAGFGLLTLLGVTAAVTWLWRLIGNPLARLTAASNALGRLDGPIEAPTRLREFAALRDAMSDASAKIASDSRELEARVAARTGELAEANTRLAAESEERVRVQAMLAHAQKMEAVGNLTGGIAHDFNNLLQVVGGNLDLLARHVAEEPRAQRRLAQAKSGVERGAKLAAQLLAFGRRQPLAARVIGPGRLLRGMEDMLRRGLGDATEIEFRLPPGLWNIMADPGNVENAVLNLAINARDAMAGAGRIVIAAANAELDAAAAHRFGEIEPGRYVALTVRDHGCGMSEAVQQKVFEPFFSTKAPGKGTGLGLSMVYGFVRQSGGHVRIESRLGEGTSVTLYLPFSEEAETRESEGAPIPHGGSETILVVEDDDAVRDTVVEMLSRLGYTVLGAGEAEAALRIVEAGAAIDVLFSDVVMPGPLRSLDLAKRASAIRPRLRALFTSGYADETLQEAIRAAGFEILAKPYSADALAQAIRRGLDTASGASPGIQALRRPMLV